VQVAGVHHNPTPGPAGSPFAHGHVFVVPGLLVARPARGAIAPPLPARRCVREVDSPGIDPEHRPAFRTEQGLAVELLRVVADGARAKAAFLKPAASLGMRVVGRLRKDAALRTVPGPRPRGRRGRPRVYGEGRIDLAKRAGRRRGRAPDRFVPYGERAVKLPGDEIRAVLRRGLIKAEIQATVDRLLRRAA